MKIIIFGGTFDPIHKAHIEIAKKAFDAIGANCLYFVPAKNVSYKNINASGDDRMAMIKLAIEPYADKFFISNYELIDDAQISYTYKLIDHFKNAFPHDELYFLIGNDQLLNFKKWEKYQSIISKAKLLVYQRDFSVDYNLLNELGAQYISGQNYSISSSDILNNWNLEKLDIAVVKYIVNHGLYIEKILKKYVNNDRYLHSMRVAAYMKSLFKKNFPQFIQQAYICGLYHDICKNMSKVQLEFIAYDILGLKSSHYKILHGPVGAYLLEKVFLLDNKMILNAIARHTKPFDFGTGPITLLDKAIYCCDKLEPCRTEQDINNIEYFRKLLEMNIDECFIQLYEATDKQYKK